MEQKKNEIITKKEGSIIYRIWFVGVVTGVFLHFADSAFKIDPLLNFLIIVALCCCSWIYSRETYKIFKIQNKRNLKNVLSDLTVTQTKDEIKKLLGEIKEAENNVLNSKIDIKQTIESVNNLLEIL